MNSLLVKGKLGGLIMAAGSLVILLMLSDLLYKGILIAADAADAAIRNRDRRDVRLLTGSGNFSLISGVFHGTARTLLPALSLSGILLYFYPGKNSILLSAVICMWGIGFACVFNIRYCWSCSAHAGLFIRKFHASFTSCQDRGKALDEACAALPAGSVRSEGITAGGRLTGGTLWPDAVRVFDNGMLSGKGVAIFLNLYDSSAADPDEAVVNAFAGTFEGLASCIRNRVNFLGKKWIVLAMAMLFYTLYSFLLIFEVLPDRNYAVILVIGLILAASSVLYRNMCVKGWLL